MKNIFDGRLEGKAIFAAKVLLLKHVINLMLARDIPHCIRLLYMLLSNKAS